jgi:hypothetical protein
MVKNKMIPEGGKAVFGRGPVLNNKVNFPVAFVKRQNTIEEISY